MISWSLNCADLAKAGTNVSSLSLSFVLNPLIGSMRRIWALTVGSCVTICCSSDQCAGLFFQSSVASSNSTNGLSLSSVGTSIIDTARRKA